MISKKIKRYLKSITVFSSVYICTAFNSLHSQSPSYEDSGLIPPQINTSPIPDYDYEKLDYGMTIGIERTPKGRIWGCWVGGGDNDDAFFVLNWSDNDGKTWTKPKVVVDPHDPTLKFKRNTLVGNLWLDPLGRLWLFFSQSLTQFDGRAGNWYTICNNPDSSNPTWSAPVRMGFGMSLNKPVILKDGSWVAHVSLWDEKKIREPFQRTYPELDSLRMAHIFISKDQGKTWNRQGGVRFPAPMFDEHHVIERKDGTLWMTARTANGIWESVSADSGLNWSEPVRYMNHISSRHHIRRLKSGRILLVKHGNIDEKTKFRSKLTAYLSEDEGKSWIGGLMIDERRGISYPDGFQAPDGYIYVSYDRNRDWDGEILMAKFTEQDILEKKLLSRKSKLKILIAKPLGLDKLPAPTEASN